MPRMDALLGRSTHWCRVRRPRAVRMRWWKCGLPARPRRSVTNRLRTHCGPSAAAMMGVPGGPAAHLAGGGAAAAAACTPARGGWRAGGNARRCCCTGCCTCCCCTMPGELKLCPGEHVVTRRRWGPAARTDWRCSHHAPRQQQRHRRRNATARWAKDGVRKPTACRAQAWTPSARPHRCCPPKQLGKAVSNCCRPCCTRRAAARAACAEPVPRLPSRSSPRTQASSGPDACTHLFMHHPQAATQRSRTQHWGAAGALRHARGTCLACTRCRRAARKACMNEPAVAGSDHEPACRAPPFPSAQVVGRLHTTSRAPLACAPAHPCVCRMA